MTDVLNVLSTNAAHAIIPPAMQTFRHPYLLAKADTIGPVLNQYFLKVMCLAEFLTEFQGIKRTCTQVNTAQATSYPSYCAFTNIERLCKIIQKYSKSVRNTIYNHVTHK